MRLMFCIVMRRGLTIVVRFLTLPAAAGLIETTSKDNFFSAAGCCAAMELANANATSIKTAILFFTRTFLQRCVILRPAGIRSNDLKDTLGWISHDCPPNLVRAESFHRIDVRGASGGAQHCEQQHCAQHSQRRDPGKRIARADPVELCFDGSCPAHARGHPRAAPLRSNV